MTSIAQRIFCTLLLAAPSLFAADRLLLPLPAGLAEVPGAYGSQWKVVLSAFNGSAADVRVRTSASRCVLGTCPVGVFTIPPGASTEILSADPTMIVTFSPNAAVSFNARVFDTSRLTTDWGTELPIVAPDEFAPGVWLLDVPNDRRFRLLLRVYELLGGEDTTVVVRIRDAKNTESVLSEQFLKLDALGSGDPFDFGFAQTAIPDLDAATVHLEIVPLTPSKQIWGFVSITHNETQRVTLVTPQPRLD